MGLFDNLFDKREKMEYRKGCDYIFNLALIQKVQYLEEYSDIDESDYRSDIIGVVAAYLDTKPQEKCVRTLSTFGKDAIYYGTVHGTMLNETHPIQATLKMIFLPKCKIKHGYYSEFVRENMDNSINATNARTLASEILRYNNITADATKINTIVVDINVILELVDAILSKYRFV